MFPIDSKSRSLVAVLVIFIAFVWIGCAYILGTESEIMLLHPIVPILLILLLFGFRGDDSVRRVITIAIVFISFWVFRRLQSVFLPFVIGFSLAYVVNVGITGLQKIPIPLPKGRRFHLPKGAAVAILMILLIGVLTFFALGIIPQLVKEAGNMKDGIVHFYNWAKDYTMKTLEEVKEGRYPFKDRLPESWRDTIESIISKASLYMQEKIPTAFTGLLKRSREILAPLSSGVVGTIGKITTVFFILIVFMYALQSFQSHKEKIKSLIPENQRPQVVRYVSEIDTNMRSFLKGQLAVIAIISVLSIIGYSIIGVPFAMLVGLLAGLSNAIPTVGPIIGGGIAVLASVVGFVAGNYGLTRFLIQLAAVLGVVFLIQILDNTFISPKIMSSAVEVHPLVVIFAVLLAANLVGIWGAVLAIPGIVVFKAVIKVSAEIRAEREAREIGLETGAQE